MTFVPGNRLGAYEIAAALGAGGMGEVYRAHDGKLGREVAIKVLPEEFAEDPERLARIRNWPSDLTRRAPLAGQQQNR